MSQIVTHTTASGIGAIITLTGNSGGPIGPDGAGNINVVTNAPSIYSTVGTNPTSVVGAGHTLTATQNYQAIFTGTTAANQTIDLFTITTTADSAITLQVLLVGASAGYTESFGGTTVATINNIGNVIDEAFVVNNTGGPSLSVSAGFVIGGVGPTYSYQLVGSSTLVYNWQALVTWQIVNV